MLSAVIFVATSGSEFVQGQAVELGPHRGLGPLGRSAGAAGRSDRFGKLDAEPVGAGGTNHAHAMQDSPK